MSNKSVIVFDDCKKCGPNVEFYFYPNNTNHQTKKRCKPCVLKARKNRYSNKSLREHDLKYQEKWVLENPDKTKEYQQTIQDKEKNKRESLTKIHNRLVLSFIEDNKEYLTKVFTHFEVDLSEDLIKKALRSIYLPKENFKSEIFKFCSRQYYAKTKLYFMWNISTKLKYKHNVRENYQDASEELKKKIRCETNSGSKETAKKKLNEKLASYESI